MASTLEGTIELQNGMAFRATSGSGHSITLDTSPDVGGTETGPTPMELLLLALGGCTGMDVISILRKARQDVTAYSISVQGDRRDEHPKVYTSITVEHTVRGRNLNPDVVHRAIMLSATKYCPASAMLAETALMAARYRIVDEATGVETAGTLDGLNG